MGARILPAADDPIRPHTETHVTITVDGESVTGISGQSIAGVIMARDQLELRRTASAGRPRGVLCGIGVCFDCLVEVNGVHDVRACQRKACEGDAVNTGGNEQASPPISASSPSSATLGGAV